MEERMGFVEGLELARQVSSALGITDPEKLREAAGLLEARATTSLEWGCATGYRLIAEDLEDPEPQAGPESDSAAFSARA